MCEAEQVVAVREACSNGTECWACCKSQRGSGGAGDCAIRDNELWRPLLRCKGEGCCCRCRCRPALLPRSDCLAKGR